VPCGPFGRGGSAQAARKPGRRRYIRKVGPPTEVLGGQRPARDRILKTAYELFSRHGIRAVGIDRIISESGVAKMSLYRNFHSKDELVLAFLAEREQRWTRDWLVSEVERRGQTGAERLLAIFDVFGEWFAQADFEGCSFINVLLEFPEVDHPVRCASAGHLATIRGCVREFAEQAGVEDPDALASQWHILMKGSIVAAAEGDAKAAERAHRVGELLLESEGALTSR
jgi:AcrR family transcriptional regulator